MPRLRRLSGREVIAILARFAFRRTSQRGSHVKLVRSGPAGEREVLTIPDHAELDRGTPRAIFRQATRYISADDLHPHFYHD